MQRRGKRMPSEKSGAQKCGVTFMESQIEIRV